MSLRAGGERSAVFNQPGSRLVSNYARSAATFGVVTSAKTMRELQLGLKYVS
jgi:hypothetical protein